MIFWAVKFIWIGIAALGLQFLYVGVRVRFDRNYAFFGLSLLPGLAILAVVIVPSLTFGSTARWGAGAQRLLAKVLLPAL